jgi:hypothetical protein
MILWHIGLIDREAVELTNSYGTTYISEEKWLIVKPSLDNKQDMTLNDVYPSLNDK